MRSVAAVASVKTLQCGSDHSICMVVRSVAAVASVKTLQCGSDHSICMVVRSVAGRQWPVLRHCSVVQITAFV